MRPTFPPHFAIFFALAATSAFAGDAFVDTVAPILARRCLSCHNETKSEGDLSMVDPNRLVEDGYVDVSDAQPSQLLELISPKRGRAEMPKDADPLTSDEIASIRDWINRGARIPAGFRVGSPRIADRNWWSLRPIERSSHEASEDFVDELVNKRLSEKGLRPLPPADPVTLIRRVTYDLSGLPPTPDQIDAFLAANHVDSDQAWEQLVDRLIDAPEFGEKWGQHWLDIARYAETHGYDKDQPRNNAWPYRDYVIGSLNADKPFGMFAIEQIAGDVLAEDSAEGIVATGFLAAGPWDLIAHKEVGEEKLDGRIAKHLDRDEMATAVFNVFQSTTIQCAQCHDHKFDPIESKDYYRVHAVFAGIDRADRVYQGLSAEQLVEKQTLQDERDEIVARRDGLKKELDLKVAKQTSAIVPEIEALTKKVFPFPPPKQHGFHSRIVKQADTMKWIEVDLGEPKRLERIELIGCYDDFNGIGAGFGFPIRFIVETTADESFSAGNTRVLLDKTEFDFANPRVSPVVIGAEGEPIRIIRVTATKLAHRRDDFIFALGELRVIDRANQENIARFGSVTASDHITPNARWSPSFLVDGQFYRQSANEPERSELDALRKKRQAIVDSISTPDHKRQIERWDEQISTLDQKLDAFPAGELVYAAATDFRTSGKFRPTKGVVRSIHLLARGDLNSPGERLLPGAPNLWPDAPTDFTDQPQYDEADARASLGRYVTRKDNPLLWRSCANRLWQWTFGKPLVGTPNDFGRMGAMPTHPELLDRLAARLRDDPNQSIKSIVRLLVGSQAYRRASFHAADPARIAVNAAIDRNNDYLWRFNRRRLTAEEFRDTVLSVSGTLRQNERGGPSFHDFVIEQPQHSPHYEYDLHDPGDVASHRRAIYRFVVRSQPQPMLTTLDCADPSISIARRNESTTALQALVQWNNRLVEAMARRFATRLAGEALTDEEAAIIACRLAWGRAPTEAERLPLTKLLGEHGKETLCRVVFNASAMMYLD